MEIQREREMHDRRHMETVIYRRKRKIQRQQQGYREIGKQIVTDIGA